LIAKMPVSDTVGNAQFAIEFVDSVQQILSGQQI
jgi:hypothetical protein